MSNTLSKNMCLLFIHLVFLVLSMLCFLIKSVTLMLSMSSNFWLLLNRFAGVCFFMMGRSSCFLEMGATDPCLNFFPVLDSD